MECGWVKWQDGEPVSNRKQIEDLLWTATRTRGGGRKKIQGGFLQQEVVRSGSPIKWSTPLPLMATVQTQMVREEGWSEYTRMMVLQQQDSLETTESGPYEIQAHGHRSTSMKRAHKSERQVLMQYMKSCPQRSYTWKIVTCNNMCKMTEI